MCLDRNSSRAFRPGFTLALLLVAAALLLTIPPSTCAAGGQSSSAQALWAAYWTIEPGYTSTLEMKNNLVHSPLDLSVSLYFASGEEYPLSPISVGPRQTVVLDVSSIIASLPPAVRARAGTQGTLEVDFNAPTPSALMGSVSVANPAIGTAWNFFLYAQRPDPTPLPLRGVFWFPNNQSDGFIALQNISGSPVSISPRFEINSHSYLTTAITLASGQGLKFELRKELNKLGVKDATAGGIEFTYQGAPDAVKAHGALFDDRGFSAEIDFIRYDSSTDGQTFSLRTPRFAIGHADPVLGLPSKTAFEPVAAFHNFESDPLNITLLVGYMQGDTPGAVTIPLTVLPGNTPVIPLHRYLQSIPPEVSWASLQVSYTAGQGSLTAAMVSTSQDGEHSIRSVLNWVEGSNREGWYWRADSQRDTLVSILNTDTQDARVTISLDYYQDGVAHSYDLPERTLLPGATSLLDIGAVISSGKPDANGSYFPLGVNFGGYHVRKIGQHIDKTITTEALVFDRRTKTFTTFYNTCCGVSGVPTFTPSLFSGPPGPLGNFLIQCTDYCSGQTIDMTGSSTFSSSNSGVATVSSAGAVSGVAPGSTNSNGYLTYEQQHTVDTCLNKNAFAPTPTNVISATITVHFTGTKTSGDNLTFPSTQTCSQSLRLFNCPGPSTWVWNVEIAANVTDDASKWTTGQSYTGRAKGNWKDSQGVLHAFDDPLNVTNDNPSSSFVQQPAGQKAIFWIDAPGHRYTYGANQPIDSLTQVENFTSKGCSTVNTSLCFPVTWYLKLVVNPGAVLDTTNSKADFGSASTNF
jgi:hypothetical protein